MITALVTGVGGGVGQGILKCLRRIKDMDIRIVAADMSPMAAGLYGADIARLVPAYNAVDYVDRVVEICRSEAVDYYFPGTDVELEICAKNAERIQTMSGTRVIVSPLSVIRLANDKYETFRFLKENGFSYPTTYLPDQVDPDVLRYPVIIKPRIGWHSVGVERINNADKLRDRLNTCRDIVIQEFAGSDDQEYTCTVVSVEGRLSIPVVLKRVLRAGDTYRAQPVRDEVVSDYVHNIAQTLGVYGSCNFQLRTDQNIPKLFEINCRFSGTTPFCAALGMNPVEYFLKTDLGIRFEPQFRYDVTVFRAWSEIIVDNKYLNALSDIRKCIPKVEDYGVL